MAASRTPPNPKLRCARGSILTADANAAQGKTIVKGHPDRTLTIVDAWLRHHGTASGNTSMDLVDTTTGHTGTHVVVFTRAGTVGNDHVCTAAGASNTTATNLGTPMTKGKGIKLISVGTLATTTDIDYAVYYYVTQ